MKHKNISASVFDPSACVKAFLSTNIVTLMRAGQ